MHSPQTPQPATRSLAIAPGQEALLVRLFADFLLARQRLLGALHPQSSEPLRPALQSACSCFYELAEELLPQTPEEILVVLTKNVVLNACRAACLAKESAGDEQDTTTAHVVEMICSQL